MSDVFISYKRRLRPQVERIATALRDLKVDVWFDAALEPGVSFSAEISHEVRNAGCVLVCWSNDAFPHGGDENGWVLGEASIGRKRGRLVTVMLEETEFDPPWNMIHTERLTGFDPDDFAADRTAWRGMLAAIGRLIERPGLADYDRAMVAGTADALKTWAQSYPTDVLAQGVWTRVEEIELATVRKRLAEERVRQPDPAPQARAETAREPDRVYAPLPEIVLEPPAAAAHAAPTDSSPAPAPSVGAAPSTRGGLSPVVAVILASLACIAGSIMGAFSLQGQADYGTMFNIVALGGPFVAMLLLGIALQASRIFTTWRTVVFVIVGYVAYFLAVWTADYLTQAAPSFGTEGADIFGGFTAGSIGAAFVLITFVMLCRNPNLGRAIPISLSGVLLIGVAVAVVMVVPGVSIRNDMVIWTAPVWYATVGAVLVWLLAEPKRD